MSDHSFDILSISSDDQILWPPSSPSPPLNDDDDYILLSPPPRHSAPPTKSQAIHKSRQPKKQKQKQKQNSKKPNGLGSRPIVDDVSESGTNNDDNNPVVVNVSMYEEAVNYMTA